MPDFSKRATSREIMDDLAVDGPDLQQALRELDAINYGLGGNYVTLKGLQQLVGDVRGPLKIADIGCGSGDMLKRIRAMLERRKIDAELMGFDANPNVARFARDHTPPTCRIHYEVLDILSDEFRRRNFDIITATLFFHHFTDEQLVQFLSGMRNRIRLGLVINDLHRHWFAYHAIRWITRVLSRSQMVRNDAPLSVLRGFSRREMETVLKKAGFTSFTIKWCWAFRWQVIVRSNDFAR